MNDGGDTRQYIPWKIYIDESRISDSRYKLMGSIWIRANQGWPFVNAYHNITRALCGVEPAMLHWTKMPSKLNHKYVKYYTSVVDLFYEFQLREAMFYRCLIVGSDYKLGHEIYHQGDPEVGFHKLYYQLIQPVLDANRIYHMRIAQRPVNMKYASLTQHERLQTLMHALNAGFRKRVVGADYNAVGSVEIRQASNRRLIQLADVLTGAVGFHWEGFDRDVRSNKGKVKAFLSDYIAAKLNRKDLRFTTSLDDRTFNVFYMRPGV